MRNRSPGSKQSRQASDAGRFLANRITLSATSRMESQLRDRRPYLRAGKVIC